jgi:hypothetical protein
MFAGIGAPIEGTAQVARWVYISWTAPCNALGCADQYRVTWTINGAAQPQRTLTGLRDSFQVTVPLPPATVTVSASVIAVRRGIASAARASQTLTLRQNEEPPPPVDSVKIDTLPPGLDVGVVGLTVGQAVWSDSGPHAVTLVARRNAVVRAWVAGASVTPPPLTLTAVQTDGQRDTLIVTRPSSLGTSPSPLTASYVASLPAALVRPGVQVLAAIRVADDTATNNTMSTIARVQYVPPIRVHLVPVVNVGRTAVITAAMMRDARDWALRLWPLEDVEVTVAAQPYVSSADTLRSNDSNGAWLTILGQMNVYRQTLAGVTPNTHVVGVLPVTFSSGIAGYAFVPGRAMVVWDKGSWGRVYSHELGHNLSRRHVAACGSGNVDTNYPYPSGQVGVHGLIGPALVTPSSHTDIMGYCSTQHVSDYTWRGAMLHRGVGQPFEVQAAVAEPEPVLAVSAVLTGTGATVTAEQLIAEALVPDSGPLRIRAYEGETLVLDRTVRAEYVDHSAATMVTALFPFRGTVTHVELLREDGGLPLVTRVAVTGR